MNIIGIIPARMASSQFPGKPLAKIHGMPMIGHCYIRSIKSKLSSDCFVATPDLEIFNYIQCLIIYRCWSKLFAIFAPPFPPDESKSPRKTTVFCSVKKLPNFEGLLINTRPFFFASSGGKGGRKFANTFDQHRYYIVIFNINIRIFHCLIFPNIIKKK